MLHYVQDVVLYSEFLELFHLKQLPAATENETMRVVRVNQNSDVGELNSELQLKSWSFIVFSSL